MGACAANAIIVIVIVNAFISVVIRLLRRAGAQLRAAHARHARSLLGKSAPAAWRSSSRRRLGLQARVCAPISSHLHDRLPQAARHEYLRQQRHEERVRKGGRVEADVGVASGRLQPRTHDCMQAGMHYAPWQPASSYALVCCGALSPALWPMYGGRGRGCGLWQA